MHDEKPKERGYWNPYVAGFALGLVLLASFYVLGSGLGASGSFTRLVVAGLYGVSPDYVTRHLYAANYANGGAPLMDWLVFMGLGVFLGGFLGGITAGRVKAEVTKGVLIGNSGRIVLALAGGALAGFGSRLANGCTSGQALTGGAEMALGSWAFMFAVFGGAYGAAYFVRKQWTWEKPQGACCSAGPASGESAAQRSCCDAVSGNTPAQRSCCDAASGDTPAQRSCCDAASDATPEKKA